MDPTNSVSVPDVLRFDAILSDYRPFGDSSYIDEQMRGAFKRRLEEIGTTLLVAHQLRASLDQADAEVEYRTLGDPVVRCAIQHALWQIRLIAVLCGWDAQPVGFVVWRIGESRSSGRCETLSFSKRR